MSVADPFLYGTTLRNSLSDGIGASLDFLLFQDVLNSIKSFLPVVLMCVVYTLNGWGEMFHAPCTRMTYV